MIVDAMTDRVQTGFTLLEVLIATVLLAIMMTLLLGSLRVGVTSWEQGERRAEQASRLLVTHNFLRSHLSGVLPLLEKSAGGQAAAATPPVFSFRGGSETLEYVGTLPPQVRGGLYKFELYLAGDGDRQDMKLAMRPFAAGNVSESGESIEDVVVLENVESLRINFLPAASVERQSQWLGEWREQFLPALIRLEITVQGDPPWPPLIIAPRVESAR